MSDLSKIYEAMKALQAQIEEYCEELRGKQLWKEFNEAITDCLDAQNWIGVREYIEKYPFLSRRTITFHCQKNKKLGAIKDGGSWFFDEERMDDVLENCEVLGKTFKYFKNILDKQKS